MTHDQKVISLQTWWMGELKKITQAVMDAEAKRQAKQMKKEYHELEGFRSENDIIDAYGFGCITERKKDHLIDLWMRREEGQAEDPLYRMKLALLEELYQTAKRIAEENGHGETDGSGT